VVCTATVSGRRTTLVDGSARGGDVYVAAREDFFLAIREDPTVATREDFFMATDTSTYISDLDNLPAICG